MDFQTLNQRMADAFSAMSPQLQRAARHVLDRPDDVALMSMRSLASVAGVHPSTMVRLARAMGFAGYREFREPFQQRLRVHPAGYLARVRDLQARGTEDDTVLLLRDVLTMSEENLNHTFDANGADAFVAGADCLAQARRVFSVGLRSCFPVAFFFYYAHRMFRPDVVLLGERGGTFADEMRDLSPDDVVFAVSIEPYTAETVRAVDFAKARGASVVAVTDSAVSPIARYADHTILIRRESPSFFGSVAAALVVAEALIVLLAARGGESALHAIEESERQLDRFEAYWHGPPRPASRRDTASQGEVS